MKLENNWQQKSLENLEKRNIGFPEKGNTRLVNRVLQLRKIPLDEFTIEDIRLVIGQNEGLKYLVRMAIDVLKKNLFAEGDFYPGDLLKNVLTINSQFWIKNKELWFEIDKLINDKIDLINENDISVESFYNSIK
jgi:hypothetical protein